MSFNNNSNSNDYNNTSQMTNFQAQDMRYNVYNRGIGNGDPKARSVRRVFPFTIPTGFCESKISMEHNRRRCQAVSATDAVVAGGTL